MEEFAITLKNIQQELQSFKQNQQQYFTPNVTNQQEYDARPIYQGQEAAKNLLSQPVTYTH